MFIVLMIPTQPDTASVTAAQSAAETFARLYEQYLPRVFSYVTYRIEDRNTAEDITSAIFEKALTRFGSYDTDKAAFSTWIFTIARNTLIDHYRGRQRDLDLQKEMKYRVVVMSSSADDDAARSEEIGKLRECLKKLNQHEQEIVTMKFGGEMTNREIARVLGLTESNVGVILCRTIRKLRDHFKEWQHV